MMPLIEPLEILVESPVMLMNPRGLIIVGQEQEQDQTDLTYYIWQEGVILTYSFNPELQQRYALCNLNNAGPLTAVTLQDKTTQEMHSFLFYHNEKDAPADLTVQRIPFDDYFRRLVDPKRF